MPGRRPIMKKNGWSAWKEDASKKKKGDNFVGPKLWRTGLKGDKKGRGERLGPVSRQTSSHGTGGMQNARRPLVKRGRPPVLKRKTTGFQIAGWPG